MSAPRPRLASHQEQLLHSLFVAAWLALFGGAADDDLAPAPDERDAHATIQPQEVQAA
jgi:hypothetical protein